MTDCQTKSHEASLAKVGSPLRIFLGSWSRPRGGEIPNYVDLSFSDPHRGRNRMILHQTAFPLDLGAHWIALKSHNERSSAEVAEEPPGKFGELLGSPEAFQKLGGDPVSLPAKCPRTPPSNPRLALPSSGVDFFFGFGKRGLLAKGSFQESPNFLEILENV